MRPSAPGCGVTRLPSAETLDSLPFVPFLEGRMASPCPECGAPMRERTATRGRNAGRAFLGCTDYPSCRGTRDLIGVDDPRQEPASGSRRNGGPAPQGRRRVPWLDGSLQRPGWICSYRTIGGSMRCAPERTRTGRYGSAWVARADLPSYAPADADTKRVIGMVRKILQRGAAPPLHPTVERELALRFWPDLERVDSRLPGDLSFRLVTPPPAVPPFDLPSQDPLDPVLPFDSEEERLFLFGWIPDALGGAAAKWFVPQASLDRLLRSHGKTSTGDRRVDFLCHVPWRDDALVVEIDGEQHLDAATIDDRRDDALASIGTTVVRVPAAQVRAGAGKNLDAIAEWWGDAPEARLDLELLGPAQVHRAVLGLLEGLEAGFLAGARWVVEVEDPLHIVSRTLGPYLGLFAAVDSLWGSNSLTPDAVVLNDASGSVTYRRVDRDYELAPSDALPPDMALRLQVDRTPTQRLPEGNERLPQVVVRAGFPPVWLSEQSGEGSRRIPARVSGANARPALRAILQAVFAKADFRDGQFDALAELLEGRDCAVLLPTGAGKSLIYQMAGIVLPGRTLVVDPITALIEDQMEGLHAHGIDRVVAITGERVRSTGRDALHEQIAAADALFVLVAPERLQIEEFRSALLEMAVSTPVNLAVIDEAHCVSEWGHDFRPSYLNLGGVIRDHCADAGGQAPPVLALTGTASRAVLRDVLIQLQIEQRSEHSIVRPQTFDRPELNYLLSVADPKMSEAALRGALRGLPDLFSRPAATFFQPAQSQTFSGIIFCPTVNGSHGLGNASKAVAAVTGAACEIYAGSPPSGVSPREWDARKAQAARMFKADRAPVLAATKAFGMGIDKPNIRWVIHWGIPGSIEAYYQEVGRAGRDREEAWCVLVLTDFDEKRSRQILSEDLALEEARLRFERVKKSERDDVSTQIFFHLGSFPGIEEEVRTLEEVVRLIEPGEDARHEIVTFSDEDRLLRERAVYRLALLGVVADYTIDWSNRAFALRLRGATPASVQEHLLAFVERSQPARVAGLRSELATVETVKLERSIIDAARVLTQFVYDTVERSRRRSLREMYLAARESGDDPTLRRRILDYLSEGDVTPELERLADEEIFAFEPWLRLIDEVATVDEARELRGAAGRLLSSHPDHPGLLLCRGMAELLDHGGRLEEFSTNIEDALRSAEARYLVSRAEVTSTCGWVATRVQPRRGAWVAATVGLLFALGAREAADLLMRRNLQSTAPAAGVLVHLVADRLARALATAEEVATLYRGSD